MVEILVVLAAVAILSGGAVILVNNAIRTAKEQKLTTDVATINTALSTFIGNGGDLEGAKTSAEIIDRIKTRAEEEQADRLVGVRSGLLDPRIEPIDQSDAEAARSEPRVYFDPTKRRFVLAYNGPPGIKGFYLDESKADAVETQHKRRLVTEYSKKGKKQWVWDYGKHSIARRSGPDNLSTNPIRALHGTSGGPSPLQLDPPLVSVPGDRYPLGDYESLQVALTNPNPQGTSEVFYSVVSGVWERYLGPFTIEPGMNLETQSASVDPDNWTDSTTTTDQYSTTPLPLDISIAFTSPTYDYISLGGALEAGDYPPPTLSKPGMVTLLNADAIPAQFLNSGIFNIQWTLDQTDPRTEADAKSGSPFSGRFPGQEVSVWLDTWGPGDEIDVTAVAKSHSPEIVTDSKLVVASLTSRKIQLRQPALTIDNDSGEGILELQSDFGDTPLGAWIYYTTDGSDPGIAADGGPVSGTVYNGAIPDAAGLTLKARVYAPVLYRQWFIPSDVVVEKPNLPAIGVGFTMSVSTVAP